MAPKKKGNMKVDDDWETEALGTTSEPPAVDAQEPNDTDLNPEPGAGGGGALLAAIKRNRQNKKKKGKAVDDDIVAGEDPPYSGLQNGQSPQDEGRSNALAPEEADADDIFATPAQKGKAAKGKGGSKEPQKINEDDKEDDEGGGLKSKKEKEKEKREREKQRKREQVWFPSPGHF